MVVDKYSENIMLTSEKGKSAREYWLKKLKGEPSVSCFPKENWYFQEYKNTCNKYKYIFPNEIFDKIARMCNKSDYAAYMILLSGVAFILKKYTGSLDIVIGMPSFIQKNNEDNMENILALRTTMEENENFKSMLGKIKNTVLEADKNQNFPFTKTAQILDLQLVNDKYNFSTIVMLDSIHKGDCLNKVNADVVFTFSMKKNELQLNIEYNSSKYSELTIQRIVEHLKNYYILAINNMDKKLCDIDIMTDIEKQRILIENNKTKFDYHNDKTINELFEEQVQKTPNNIAVVHNNMSLSYLQLNEKANKLAGLLRKKGLKSNNIVPIMLKRSIEIIVAILAVLKAGGAYLPIDTSYPMERIKYMLEDSGADILLAGSSTDDENISDIILDKAYEVIDVYDNTIYEEAVGNLKTVNKANNLAYVIYTSGSTGKPKGVMLEHKGIANLKEFFRKEFNIVSDDRILQFASSSFDASVWEIFMALLAGATLHLPLDETIKDLERFQSYINQNKITVMTLPPTYLVNINPENIKTIRMLITAGSATTKELVEKWNNKVTYINAYGPTETTVCTTIFKCNQNMQQYNTIPIGKPILNTKIYIVDKDLKLVPEGVAGELCVTGDTLARGYLNRPKLTKEKFIDNPYIEGKKMYKTGDLARWLTDGNIEFLGRIDHQVKIRGYRIEIGEIEAKLIAHYNITEAFVKAWNDENGDKYLCAYVVIKENTEIKDIKEYIAKELPDYMIPAFFIELDNMPLTINGKVDSKKLPNPKDYIVNVEYVEPRDEKEKLLASIWEDVLGVERVSIKDSFFELGGDSIKGIQVLSRLKKHKLILELKDIFQNKDIENISKVMIVGKEIEIEQNPVEGLVDLSPIQKWFFEKKFTNMNHWNQSVMLYGKKGFDSDIVTKVFEKIIEHHDSLRMIYKIEENEIQQYNRDIREGKAVELNVYNLTKDTNYVEKVEEYANNLQSSIDIENGPLVKLSLFKTPKGDNLLIVIHHLVIDGISWRIVFEDFATAYKQIEDKKEISFQDKTHSYKEWSSKLKEYASSKQLKKEIEYWKEIEGTHIPKIPTDNEIEESSKIKDSNSVEIKLTEEVTNKLLKEVNKAYNTEINDILLTTLGLAVKEWSYQDKVLVNLEGHGRENIVEGIDITRTVGWFTSQYPVLLSIDDEKDISFTIKSVKEALRKIPNKGVGYSILRYLSGSELNNIKYNNTAEISFNYLGQFGQDINTDLFTLSELPIGESMSLESESLFKLNINSLISDGKLVLSVIFDNNQYNRNTIEDLLEIYRKNLLELINHCTNKEKQELTPIDVGCKDLTVKQFDKIYDFWGDDIKSIYRLSPTQEGMLFHAVMDTESHTYFQQITFVIKGFMDVELLEKSFNTIIERHDILRTNFIYKSLNTPLQVVLQRSQIEVHFEDVSSLDNESAYNYIENYKIADRNKGFDLSKDMLIRLAVIKSDEDTYKFIWSFHHILMDGWCLGIINKELFETYKALKQGRRLELKKAPAYKDFIEWLENQDEEEAKDYWTRYLADYENTARIPETSISLSKEYDRGELNFVISKETTAKLNDIAIKNNTTPNVVLQSIWGIMLQRFNNTNDVVFGAVMSGRKSEIEGVEEIVGLFINTVPVRVSSNENMTFSELLSNMQENALLCEKYSHYPLVEIQESNILKTALLDHIMVFENYPIEKSLLQEENQDDIGFSVVDVEAFQQTNYDFSVTMFPGEETAVRLTYNSNIYDKKFIDDIENHIKEASISVIQNPNIKVNDIEILKEQEKRKILVDFNNSKVDFDSSKLISELFEKQVEKTPNNIAIVDNSGELSYKELNEKSNQLARLLIDNNVGSKGIVGIMLTPSIEMIVGILGALKAGASYLPIEADSPIQRVKQIIDDSGIKILLSQTHISDITKDFTAQVINIDNNDIYCGEVNNLQLNADGDDTAYVIYTSGTTGKPKGVEIKNSCVTNYVNWFSKWVDINQNDKTILVSSFAFDLGYTALYSSLLNGCQLHMLRKEIYSDPEILSKYIEKNSITYMKATPSLFNMLVNNRYFINMNTIMPLRLLVLGGEQINVEDIEKLNNEYKNITVVNHYGPTEATIGAIANKIDFSKIGDYKKSPTIGKPISNTEVYILDNNLKPVSIGVVGEIHIAGEGIAKGYLNKKDVTDEKFILNPFSTEYTRMYKTGDLGRFRADGSIEFLGRKDYQVKIRGYRIELSEIVSCIIKNEDIADALVIVKDDNQGNKGLCAYIVSNEKITSADIRARLSKELPDYMIPSFFIFLEKLPLTSNGKVDRLALPNPYTEIGNSVEYVAPSNEIEKIMIQIWQEVLSVEGIGVNHNFFELGGHSLKLINLVSRVYEAFNVELSPRQILEAPTVKLMAEGLANGNYKDEHPLMLLNSKGKKNIFCFPPVGGYGLVYKSLADISKDHTYYSFNYIDNSSNNLSLYVQYITEVQKTGPYVLMGWSAGGNLAFEVAKEMERQGLNVERIVLVDVHRMISNMNMPKEEIQKMVNENLVLAEQDEFYKEYLSKNSFIRNRIASKMEDYFGYLRNNMINDGRVNCNIDIILSTDEVPKEQDRRKDWDEVTDGEFVIHQGVGSHPYMLYTGFVEDNAMTIYKILNNLRSIRS